MMSDDPARGRATPDAATRDAKAFSRTKADHAKHGSDCLGDICSVIRYADALRARAEAAEQWRDSWEDAAHRYARERDAAAQARDRAERPLSWNVEQLLRQRAALLADLETEREARGRAERALGIYAKRSNWFQTTHIQPGDWPVKVWAWDDMREPWTMAEEALSPASGGPARGDGEG